MTAMLRPVTNVLPAEKKNHLAAAMMNAVQAAAIPGRGGVNNKL